MEFYGCGCNLAVMSDYLDSRAVSLRLLEFFITKHCFRHKHLLNCCFNDYQCRLKAYGKSLFDPFCRGKRTTILNSQGKLLETTTGQLNFFRFCLENGVLEYVTAHAEQLQDAMMTPRSTKKSESPVTKARVVINY